MEVNNKTELVYENSRLDTVDVRSLQGKNWLTDGAISFWLEYLEQEIYRSSPNFLFVASPITQLIKLNPEVASSCLQSMKANEKDLVFFPLSDNCETEINFIESNGLKIAKPLGQHWSLLVFSKVEQCCFSLDSSGRRNEMAAKQLFQSVKLYFNCERIVLTTSLQQENGYNCGIFVLCNVENICNHFLTNGGVASAPVLPREDTETKRDEILEIIKILSEENAAKKAKRFASLNALHPNASPASFLRDTIRQTFYYQLRQATNQSRHLIRNTPAVTENPLKFHRGPEVILNSLCLKISCEMLPAAINEGNIITVEMLKARLCCKEEAGGAEFFMISCPFGCQTEIYVPPQTPTCRLTYAYEHFDSDICASKDYGWSRKGGDEAKFKKNEQRRKRRHDKNDKKEKELDLGSTLSEEMSLLTLNAPTKAHEAMRIIAGLPGDVIIKLVKSLADE